MDYKIVGGNLPAVIVTAEDGESFITESGAMAWMTPNMQMETTSNGGVRKVFGRVLSGEAMFQNRYTAHGKGLIAFASSFPGEIRALDIAPGREMIVQKSAFLAAEEGVNLSVYIQKNLGGGLFGGEGFIMQELSGCGTAFIEIDGSVVEYILKPGQEMIVDTGYLAAMEKTCTMDIRTVPGLKNMFFGGEGAFNTVVKGPGRILIQTMPIPHLAGVLKPYFPTDGK